MLKTYAQAELLFEQKKYEQCLKKLSNINDLIKEVGLNFDLSKEKMDRCLKDSDAQDMILEQRIEAQKKYKIEATPTILINEKKYTGTMNYKEFKKAIEKNL